MKPRTRGFTLFELAVAIMIIALLATVLLTRLAFYQEAAEKAAMEATVRLIKTGLQIRLAELIVANRQAQAGSLETENPMRWLEAKPGNYGGPYREPGEGGTWYFDAGRHQLVYAVNTGSRLEVGGSGEEKRIRFQARLLKDRVNAGGAVVESMTAITLAPVTPYRW